MTEIPAALRTALGGRYDLTRVIGQGGMATVYLATDVRHHREVAVKVLRPDVSASIGSERFLREIQIAAQLHHPNVLTLIDSGEAEGMLYYVMPFVQGESLRGLMTREGPLEPGACLAFIHDVADALDYAHRRGVVHRDIKPENILLAEGHAFVADFGIAKAVSVATGSQLTRTGFPIGTPGYMSPEQAMAAHELDERTDVFSLAAVVYEMLVGQTAGTWPDEESQRLQRFVYVPEGHRERLDRLPAGVETTLVRAMAMRPAQRTASASEFAGALSETLHGRRPRYSADQVQAIVHRAADLEASKPTASGAMTIGGVERLAAEVGIPPEHVRDAAREVTHRTVWDYPPKPGKANPFIGTPMMIVIDREADGEVQEADFLDLVEAMRMSTGNFGQVSTLGRSLAWRTAGGTSVPRDLLITVTPRNGRTYIRMQERLNQLAGAYFGGLLGGWGGGGTGLAMGLGIGALNSVAAAIAMVVVNISGSYTVARALLRSAYRKRTEELNTLADRLAAHCEESASRPEQLGRARPPRLIG